MIFKVPHIMQHEKVIYLYAPVKPVFLLRPTQKIAKHFSYNYHIYMQFSLLNSSDIKMVPQYCFYGSAGMPAVPATIFMSDYGVDTAQNFIMFEKHSGGQSNLGHLVRFST